MNRDPLRLFDYPASCNCYKVRLLLSNLGQAYERVTVDIFNGETLTADYAEINPHRTTPVLQIGESRQLPESGAILVYLAAGTAYLPQSPLEMAEVVRWLIYEQTDVIPMIGGLRFRLLTGRLHPDHPEAVRRRSGGRDVLALLEQLLSTRSFFVAERYTIADIAIYGYCHLAGEAGLELDPYPSLRAWLKRVQEQPGYVEDVMPYGANASPGAGASIYD
jgi:glutathione S-transferase